MRKTFLAVLILMLVAVPAMAQQYTWRYQSSSDCDALTTGKFADLCYQTTDQTLWKCVPTAGDCDTAGEWKQAGGGTESDPVWLSEKSSYATTSSLSGYVPTSRTINGKSLTGNISINWEDLTGFQSSVSLAGFTADATHRLVTDTEKNTWNGKQDALGFTAVPTTRTINGQALSGNVSITTTQWDGTNIGINTTTARQTLSLVPGTDVQAYNASTSFLGQTIAANELASADFGSFTCNGTSCTIDNDAITLGTQTAGNYVSGVTANGMISMTGTEGATLGITPCVNENYIPKWNAATGWTCQADNSGAGGGYTNLTQFVDQSAWKVFYSDGSGDVKELTTGAAGTVLTGNGVTSAPSFTAPASETDPKTGTLTAGYHSKWGATTLVDSLIYDNGTNVGIGSSIPTQKLDVKGTVKATAFSGSGSGIDMSSLAWANDWKMAYSNTTGTQELAIGAANTFLMSTGGDQIPTWTASDGSGDCAAGAVCLGNHTHSGYAVATRNIFTGSGMLGGGDLSADRTLSVDATIYAKLISPSFTTPALGTPSSGVVTNLTGTATAVTVGTATTAGTVTTAAQTAITSVGTLTGLTVSGSVGMGTASVTNNLVVSGNIGIGSATPQARLVIVGSGYLSPVGVTSDPCATQPEGTLFYNSTGHFYCFCNNSGADVKFTDNSTSCF